MAYYEPNVTYCPQVIGGVIKVLLEKKLVFRRYRQFLKKDLLDWIVSSNSADISAQSASDVMICSIISFEITERFSRGTSFTTRQQSSLRGTLKETILALRKRRLKAESHLQQSFGEDVDRTIGEIHFAFDALQSRTCKSKKPRRKLYR